MLSGSRSARSRSSGVTSTTVRIPRFHRSRSRRYGAAPPSSALRFPNRISSGHPSLNLQSSLRTTRRYPSRVQSMRAFLFPVSWTARVSRSTSSTAAAYSHILQFTRPRNSALRRSLSVRQPSHLSRICCGTSSCQLDREEGGDGNRSDMQTMRCVWCTDGLGGALRTLCSVMLACVASSDVPWRTGVLQRMSADALHGAIRVDLH